MKNIIIQTQDLLKEYIIGNNIVTAVCNCNISVSKGERLAIMGKSGAGKSTLLHLLSGIDTPTDGEVEICGENITRLSASKRAEFRLEHIGYIFQDYNLIPELTVNENIQLPALLLNGKIDKSFFNEIIKKLGLTERLLHYPSELSGGQKQRAAIARAIINRPDILLCDEPTGNLDSQTSNDVVSLLNNVTEQYGITMLLVTHDPEIANSMQRIIHVSDGEILA